MAGRARRAASWDAIVVGAGHNALVCAAYLARGGLRTLVLERSERVGGALETAELAPGARVPVAAHTVGRLRPSVLRDLGLRGHGLALVAPEVRVFAPRPGRGPARGRRAGRGRVAGSEGDAVVLWANAERTAAGLAGRSERDAAGYRAFDRTVRELGGFLDALARETPPDVRSPGLGDALAGLRLGRAFRRLGVTGAHSLLRVLPMAVADFVAESVEDDALRAAIAWRGVRYGAVGPWSAGTAAVLLADGAGNDGGAAGETVFARGGPGAVADALAAAARAAGAEIRTAAPVASITTRDGVTTGVVLAGGEELAARVVVSGADPKRTLLDLVEPVALGPSLGWRAGNIRTAGVTAKVNLVLRALPAFPGAADDERLLRGRILVAPGIDALERAFDPLKYGRPSAAPILEATIPSLVDPSLVEGAAAGTQVMSVIAQYVPYRLAADLGSWDDRREAFGDAVLAVLESVAPGIGRLVTHRQVLGPPDLEARYALSGGHPLHGEAGLDQWFAWRPLLGHARYRLGGEALRGLYLCGSGAHPGGGATGGPGQNAAREVLTDLRGRAAR
jgi:phytoene dehydrogenase-like protein